MKKINDNKNKEEILKEIAEVQNELFDKRVKTKVNSKILIQIIDELINKKMEYLDKVINYEKVSEENEEE